MEYLFEQVFKLSVFLLAIIVFFVVLYYFIEVMFETHYRKNRILRNNGSSDDEEDIDGGGFDGGMPPRPRRPFPGGGSVFVFYRLNDFEYRDYSHFIKKISFSIEEENVLI